MFEIKIFSGGTRYIETECPKKGCSVPYRIDEHHPSYAEINNALEHGDRSLLRCYHNQSAVLG